MSSWGFLGTILGGLGGILGHSCIKTGPSWGHLGREETMIFSEKGSRGQTINLPCHRELLGKTIDSYFWAVPVAVRNLHVILGAPWTVLGRFWGDLGAPGKILVCDRMDDKSKTAPRFSEKSTHSYFWAVPVAVRNLNVILGLS